MKKSLFLVIAFLGLYQLSFGQGTTCAASDVLCDPATTFPASVGAIASGGG